MGSTIRTLGARSCKLTFHLVLAFCLLTASISDVFIKNPNDTEYLGQVWPGYTVRHTQ